MTEQDGVELSDHTTKGYTSLEYLHIEHEIL